MHNATLLHRVLVGLLSLLSAFSVSADVLTEEERKWLEENPRILFAPAPNYPPVEFFDEQNIYRGITADFVEHNQNQVIEQTKQGVVDMWGAANEIILRCDKAMYESKNRVRNRVVSYSNLST